MKVKKTEKALFFIFSSSLVFLGGHLEPLEWNPHSLSTSFTKQPCFIDDSTTVLLLVKVINFYLFPFVLIVFFILRHCNMNIKIRSILVVLYGLFALYATFKLGENLYLAWTQFTVQDDNLAVPAPSSSSFLSSKRIRSPSLSPAAAKDI